MSFKDDPEAENYDKIGVYFNKHTSVYYIGIGKDLTWEEAQKVYRSDCLKQMMEVRRFKEGYKGNSENYLKMC